MTIYFYSAQEEPYGCFSNFFPRGFTLEGRYWPTSEHYFQAQKFAGTSYEETIRQAKSPMIAARLGRSRRHPLRSDWEQVKETVMRQAILAKFEQNPYIRTILLNTGDEELVENAPNDTLWGCGTDGTGQNRLGAILMEVRVTLQERQPFASRQSWKVLPLPEARTRLTIERTFSPKEYERVRRGVIPQEMEDKWFIFLEDDWLYFHRSWTGFCIYQVRLEPVADGYRVAEVWVNRDPEQYTQTEDSQDVSSLHRLIDAVLLGRG
jgi:ribA/ribD-fused uncharacterized protein